MSHLPIEPFNQTFEVGVLDAERILREGDALDYLKFPGNAVRSPDGLWIVRNQPMLGVLPPEQRCDAAVSELHLLKETMGRDFVSTAYTPGQNGEVYVTTPWLEGMLEQCRVATYRKHVAPSLVSYGNLATERVVSVETSQVKPFFSDIFRISQWSEVLGISEGVLHDTGPVLSTSLYTALQKVKISAREAEMPTQYAG